MTVTPSKTPNEALGKLLLEMGETLGLLASTMGGYRTQLVDAGFSEAAAEQMAVDYHSQWARKLMGVDA